MVQWRKRKRGTPNQIGQAFPLEKESMQQKKGLTEKDLLRKDHDTKA